MTPEQNELHSEIRKMIQDGARLAAAAQTEQTERPEQPETRKIKPTDEEREQQQLSIIPYTIIKCVTALDNIYETRLFGWVLAKAQSVLKLYNKDLSEINLQHALGLTRVTLPAKYILNDGDKNYGNVVKSFGLATKKIEYKREDRLYHLNIIAFPELILTEGGRKYVTFVIHNEIWHALLDFSKGHRTFSLPTYIRLNTKYAVIMYLLCSQQTRPISYSTRMLKQMLGCDGLKSYERGANFVARVLDPAREELIAKAPYYFDYSCTKSGRSHEITEIIIVPQVNPISVHFDKNTARMACELRLRLEDEVKTYCQENFGLKAKPLERLEPLILRLGDKGQQLLRLGQIKDQVKLRRVKNAAGYLTRSLQNECKESR